MRNAVLTLVTPGQGLDPAPALRILKSAGVGGVDEPVWLDPGHAADIFFDGDNLELFRIIRQRLAAELPSADAFVQPNAMRAKKLLISDMDATIVIGETIDEMAAHLGLKDKIAPITAAAMRGEIDFPEALRQRVLLLKGMPLEALDAVKEATRFAPGAKALVRTMGRFGARCVLISGGFDMFTGFVAQRLGFHKDYANRLGVNAGCLTGEVLPPIVDKNYKKKTLEDEMHRLGLASAQVMAAGDGANDIPMLQAAGAGVGYYAKPAVVEATPHQVRHTDLTALLFMQGYRRDQFAA
jgi:phosphoserine phosphatase